MPRGNASKAAWDNAKKKADKYAKDSKAFDAEMKRRASIKAQLSK